MRTPSFVTRALALGLALAVTGAGLAGVAAPASAADPILPTPAPPLERTEDMATADALPTVQIDNGVVWDQAVVGNTVFAGGQFSQTRPAGAAAGQQLTPRSNLLAYDVRTGVLLPFAPTVNGAVKAVEVSPDGSVLYIGGTFTQVNGKPRSNLAAFDVATGELRGEFQSRIGGSFVNAIAVSDSAVYVGGLFTQANGVKRTNLAAFGLDGELTAWAPTTNVQVDAMVMAPGGDRVILGGRFTVVNGASNPCSAAVDAVTGTTRPWPLNRVIGGGGATGSGVMGLSTDGKYVYGAGWLQMTWYFEGVWAADGATGELVWAADGQGDQYGVYAGGGQVYSVGHSHVAAPFGGWPDMNTPGGSYQYSLAFTTEPKGTLTSGGRVGLPGKPAPALYQWYPKWISGKFTGMGQAGWTIEGNDQYVVVGGEFQGVNGKAQYGLARFARGTVAASAQGPRFSATPNVSTDLWEFPTFTAAPLGGRVSITPNFDRDDRTLTYELYRSGTTEPVARTTFTSDWWLRTAQTVVLTDTSAAPGVQYSYTVRAVDRDGNAALSRPVSGKSSATVVPAYVRQVAADGAAPYWRMGGTSPVQDWTGGLDGTATGLSSAATGVVKGDAGAWATGSAVSAGTAMAVSKTTATAGDAGTVELWFRSSSKTGGQLASLSSAASGKSPTVHRTVYLRSDGKITFGLTPNGTRQTATTRSAYNDGTWHHVAATVGANGMLLYVDGALVGSNLAVKAAGTQTGYWRVGTDTLAGWPDQPQTDYVTGEFDEFAAYPAALTRAQIAEHVSLARGEDGGGGGEDGGDGLGASTDVVTPADGYGSLVYATAPDFFWRLGDPVGTTGSVADSGPKGSPGKIYTAPRFGQPGAVAGNDAASFTSGGMLTEQRAVANPNAFTATAWFKTTSTRGGRIIGFGNSSNGWSGTYDRMVYLRNDGKLDFGVASRKIVTSPAAYNDGAWHQVTASLGADGMNLYVDGALVASNAAVTAGTNYTGYWKVGADYTWNSSSYYLDGLIDEAAVYSRVLTPTEIAQTYAVGTGAIPPAGAMTLTAQGYDLRADGSTSTAGQGKTIASYDWDFGDGSTGTGATASHTYAAPGTYRVTLRVTDSDGLSTLTIKTVNLDYYATAVRTSAPDFFWRLGDPVGTTGSVADSGPKASVGKIYTAPVFGQQGAVAGNGAASFTSGGMLTEQRAVANPNAFTATAWFKTTSTRGGRIIGFGNSSNGWSSTYDRMVYLRNDGKLDFGVGSRSIVTSPTAYNDGAWHQVTASLGADGMVLYVDGQAVASNAAVKAGANYTGYWKVGADYTWNSSSYYLDGLIDEAAVYSRTLAGTEVASLYAVAVGSIQPVAAVEQTVAGQRVLFDASGSQAFQGRSIASYDWDFGDGTTGTGVRPVHDYTEVGDFPVTLRVTDSAGLVGVRSVTVSVDLPSGDPTAKATVTTSGLDAVLDGSTSAGDGGRKIVSYAWDLGDGSTSDEAVARHHYAAPGTYTARLTVTDDAGRTGSTEAEVVVDATIASDDFERAGSTWGSAGVGGAWSGDKGLTVADGAGLMPLPAAGQTRNAWLKGVSARDVDVRLDFSLDKASGGGGTFVSAAARRTDAGEYRAKLVANADGTLSVFLTRIVGGVETTLKAGILPNVAVTAGTQYSLRYQAVTGEGGSTALRVRVWPSGEAEPGTWFLSASDADPAVAGPGYVGVVGYLSSASTVAPQTVRVHGFGVTAP